MDADVRGRRGLATAVEVVLASVLAVCLFASAGVVPVPGIALSLLCPLPFVVVGLRHGRMVLLAALILATLFLIVSFATLQGLVFLLEFGAPAVALEAGLRRGVRTEVVVITAAVALALGGMAALAVATGHWDRPVVAVERHLEGLFAEMESLTDRMGISDGAGSAELPTGRLRAGILAAFPGLVFVGSLLIAAGYFRVLQSLLRRWPEQLGSVSAVPFRWELPEPLVWTVIASGALLLTGMPWPKIVGLNGLIMVLGLYFLQGLSIAAFLFRRFRLPRVLAALSVILLLLQPFFTLLVAGLGLFDVWFAFRRVSLPRSPR